MKNNKVLGWKTFPNTPVGKGSEQDDTGFYHSIQWNKQNLIFPDRYNMTTHTYRPNDSRHLLNVKHN